MRGSSRFWTDSRVVVEVESSRVEDVECKGRRDVDVDVEVEVEVESCDAVGKEALSRRGWSGYMYEYELSWILRMAYVWVGFGTMNLIVFAHYSPLTLSLARRDYFGLQ